jgi:predicted deacetylase
LTLLVVPFYRGTPATGRFERWLDARAQHGDELALHGLTHCDDGAPARGVLERARRHWYTDREGEFAALGVAEATRRLNAGRRWFAHRGWPLRGFVAPAWLLGDGAWAALEQQPFRYTCTRTSLLTLPRGQGDLAGGLRASSIVFSTRAAWRRALSRPWNRMLSSAQRGHPWMRFELHPSDVEHASVCDAALDLVAAAAGAGRRALTLSAVAECVRTNSPLS